MTGRPGLEVGTHGTISHTQTIGGRHTARTRVRDKDGRVREVTATGDTKGAAGRSLKARLTNRTSPTTAGITASMTIREAGDFWLAQRARGRSARGQQAVKPQTLAAYDSALRLIVVPAMGGIRMSESAVARIDSILIDLEEAGISTAQARSALNQIFGLAMRHGALSMVESTVVVDEGATA